MQSSTLYFDRFELDLNSYELRKGGRVVKLEKLPMELLILLAERQGQLVTREQIIQRLWDDNVFVDTRQGINTAVRKLRIALQDDSEHPRLLQTVPGRGYRLLARVSGPKVADGQKEVEPGALLQAASRVEAAPANAVTAPAKERRHAVAVARALVVFVAIASLVILISHRKRMNSASSEAWTKITNFPDSATQPALSPDGHMITFIRGPDTFITRGQIYVKFLPDGQPVQLTHDNLLKMSPAFSPDGSRVAYTTTEPNYGWNTWLVPVLGGEPQKILPNAEALTWVDRQHVMFSEARGGSIMGLVTATESRVGERDVYLPTDSNGMVHRSWISPDGKWVLISEMDHVGWLPCRVLPFDGSNTGEAVGPKEARCTYAGWSPDGRTMYFSADAGDGYHLWRQHFPRGVPEQMTFGPTEEEGIAVSPDDRMLVTSAGIRESTVWVHDAKGDRQMSGEGFAVVPGLGFVGGGNIRSVFSPDGKKLFYLLLEEGSRAWNSGELWAVDLDSGASEAVLPGILMSEFHLSPKGDRVAFETQDAQGMLHAWVAPLDRRTPPKQITSSASRGITFGPGEDLYFLALDGGQNFLYRLVPDETRPRKVGTQPIQSLADISPHGDWLLSGNDPVTARPLEAGPAIRVCKFCGIGWGPDGKLLYLRFRDIGEMGGGTVVVISLAPGKDLPVLPPAGVNSVEDTKGLNVVAEIDMAGKVIFAIGPDPSVYAYSRVTVQRNLYGLPLK